MSSIVIRGDRAPIALFVYNRPEHTRRTVEALAANAGAADSSLFIFSDAPKNQASAAVVEEVRTYVGSVTGFARVTVIERETNLGLAESIIDGVTRLCEEYGRVIVLEDDLLTARGFLDFMNDALDAYSSHDPIISVCGYMYPVTLPTSSETVFLRVPHCWGWGTWKDRWSLFQRDGALLLRELKVHGRLADFDAHGPHDYTRMLEDQIRGLNDSWFIRWYATALLADKLSVYPSRSLVSNAGIDGSGVHCAEWKFDPYAVDLHQGYVSVDGRSPAESAEVNEVLARYYPKIRFLRYVNFGYRVLTRIGRWFLPKR